MVPGTRLGNTMGIALFYGSTMAIIRRLVKADKMTSHSLSSDWSFLLLIWLACVTGFILEALLYVSPSSSFGYWILIIHGSIGVEVVLLLPFTKFPHVIYRPMALFLHELMAWGASLVPNALL